MLHDPFHMATDGLLLDDPYDMFTTGLFFEAQDLAVSLERLLHQRSRRGSSSARKNVKPTEIIISARLFSINGLHRLGKNQAIAVSLNENRNRVRVVEFTTKKSPIVIRVTRLPKSKRR